MPLSDSMAARGGGRVMRLKGGSVWSESPAVSSREYVARRLCCLLLWLGSNNGSPLAHSKSCAGKKGQGVQCVPYLDSDEQFSRGGPGAACHAKKLRLRGVFGVTNKRALLSSLSLSLSERTEEGGIAQLAPPRRKKA
jgi:hypothetical protein